MGEMTDLSDDSRNDSMGGISLSKGEEDPQSYLEYMEWLANDLGFKTMEDWYKINVNHLKTRGGLSLLSRFNFSPSKILMAVYPGHNWLIWRFSTVPRGFWESSDNERAFMEWLGRETGFKKLDDWYRLNQRNLIDRGGIALLKKYGAIFKILQTIFPDHSWSPWMFETVPHGFWKKLGDNNTKMDHPKITEYLSQMMQIKQLDDWYRISYDQISKFVPVDASKYRLHDILPNMYPNHEWNLEKLIHRTGTMKASQRELEIVVQELFPSCEVKRNWIAEDMSREYSNNLIELDVYVPEQNLAFEYQGEQHYYDIYALGNRWQQKRRDSEKRRLCKEKGITLIEVPYWWNRQSKSLLATIKQYRPDFESLSLDEGESIPSVPLNKFPVVGIPELMYGEQWNGEQDLQGWWMSEKLDGVRAYWNGKHLISKQSRNIQCPSWFTQNFPQEIKLDGELWIGRKKFAEVVSLLRSSRMEDKRWKDVKYMVFDIPGSKKPYEARMEELSSMRLALQAKFLESTKCDGNNHLMMALNEIIAAGGEGLMMVKPNSMYLQKERTNTLLKVKPEDDSEVQLLEIVPTGLYCQRTNGREFIVGCFPQVLENPPAIGSVLTVKHNGFLQNGTLRHSFYWRECLDVDWQKISDKNKKMVSFADWTKVKNIKEFFDHLQRELGYAKLDDFYKIESYLVHQNGGKALLEHVFNGSLERALQYAYPNHKWESWRFTGQNVAQRFWDNQKNQRDFMEWLGKDLGLKDMDDWYRIKLKYFVNARATGLLKKYGFSPGTVIKNVFVEHSWSSWRFYQMVRGYWDKGQSSKEFLDKLGKDLNYHEKEDWYKLTIRDIIDGGGEKLLRTYGNSPSKLLKETYPQHSWLPWRFETAPKAYWKGISQDLDLNVKIIEHLRQKLRIKSLNDWYRVSHSQLQQNIYLDNIRFPLHEVLPKVYPNHKWEKERFHVTALIRSRI